MGSAAVKRESAPVVRQRAILAFSGGWTLRAMTIRYAVFRPVVVIGCAPDHVDLAPFEELATDVYDRFMGCLYQPEDVVWYDDCPSLLERFARVTMVADHEERCYRTPKFKDFPGVIPSDLKGWYIW